MYLNRFLAPEFRSMKHSGHSVERNFSGYSQFSLDQFSNFLLRGIRVLVLHVRVNGYSVEYQIVLPALVDLIQPVLDVIVGQNQTFNLGLRALLIVLIAAGNEYFLKIRMTCGGSV